MSDEQMTSGETPESTTPAPAPESEAPPAAEPEQEAAPVTPATTAVPEEAPVTEPEPALSPAGGLAAEGEYQPVQVAVDDLGGMSFADAISSTIVEFDEGDIVTGKVVK